MRESKSVLGVNLLLTDGRVDVVKLVAVSMSQ